MDETYIKVKGDWKYLYRAVDKQGKTVDFLLTARRDKAAALRFFEKAMKANGVPEKVTMDKSGANKAAMDEINARGETPVIVRQIKYLNNIVRQDHRAVKRVTKPMLNFKSFRAARLKQLRTRQDVEEFHRLGRSRSAFNAATTLMQNALGITIHGGWPSERWFGCFVNNHPIDPGSATSLCLQVQALTRVAGCRTAKVSAIPFKGCNAQDGAERSSGLTAWSRAAN